MSSTRPIANSTMPFLLLVVVILSIWRTVSAEDDTACLRKFKDSLKSSLGRFRNWNFGNFTPGSVCNFEGVQCWNQNENKVISLKLPNAGLMGLFPEGLDACSSLQALDLSGNNLSGLLPDGLCASQGGKYLTDLDLSSNTFSGPIPPSIGSCLYLHSLNLHGNRFQGLIPPQLGSLPRLGTLDLSNNLLSGEIPPLLANQSLEGFAGNTKLCGSPLPSCSSKGGIGTGAIAGIAAGAVVFVLVAVVVLALVGLRVWGREERRRKRAEMMRDEFRWVVRIEAPKSTPVSMFNKPLKPIYLSDLIAATNGFGKDNLVGRGRTGLVYKATLLDGSSLAIQRLPTLPTCAALAPKDFEAEMNALGQLRHPNLVPLLGYCLVGQERLLVYKHVTGGSLAGRLHKTPLEWPMRLKIGIGAARGLAWLHFSCNPRVLHGHMSSKSVMLDEEDDARITGFGLFRLFDGDFGDLGYYSPPEYTPWNLSASTKGDVYSFGVVLLELVIGKKAAKFCSNPPHFNGTLAEWIAYLSSSGGEGGGGGGMHEALDPSLKGSVDNEELVHFLRIACSCVASAPNERPSMYEVHQLLRSMGLKYDLSDENDEIPMTDACE